MIVLCAGTYRSGSCWLFNAVRLMMPQAGLFTGFLDTRQTLLEAEYADNAVLKVHAHRQWAVGKADIILTSHRHPVDVYASARVYAGRPANEALIDGSLVEYMRRWRGLAHYDVAYEYMVQYEPRVLDDLSFIVHGRPCEDLESVVDELDLLEEPDDPRAVHPVTLLTKDHRTFGKHALTAGQQTAVCARWKRFIELCGYPVLEGQE